MIQRNMFWHSYYSLRKIMSFNVHFEKAALKHQVTIFKWLAEPHMMEFWDNTQEHKDDILNFMHGRKQHYFQGTTQYWVGSHEGNSFCFILSDEIRPSETDLPQLFREHLSKKGKTIAIDFGIGNQDFLDKGFAAMTLKAFIQFYQKEVDHYADTFFIDPDEHNTRAIHVYQKAGFTIVGKEEPATKGGFIGKRSFLMLQRLPIKQQ
jgi:RimJ/RimL family protein N-acetyltransferase